MSRINLALLWHLHQPSYREPEGEGFALPWVRLHSTRAYFDMAWMLERHPTVRVNVNLVPILVEQLTAYVNGERDRFWALSLKPARLLTESERSFVLTHFFSCHPDTCIRPRARYWTLYNRRGARADPGAFSDQDFRDLQVLFNLAWFGFASRVELPLVGALDRKGRDFTEDEKRKLLDLQIAVMRRVVPMWSRLAARGQVELTTTPYHHPILPLVYDSEAAERCQPERPRPTRFHAPDDAREQVQRAVAAHEGWFGVRPAGMWPAEGSVSPEVLALVAEAGVEWVATDEAQLWGSINAERRADLYRPYRLALGERSLGAVFRDHALSDAIGFDYSKRPAEDAVGDFVGRIHAAADLMDGRDETPLVTVALDGENPWEYYPHSGHDFLERLYSALEHDERILTVCVGEHLRAHPPRRALAELKTGSWIDGDFHIWMGGAVENSAWDALGRARVAYAEHGPNEEAYEHLLTAEGSDWFWWYGEPFQSEQDAEFDRLFRGHLRQVYRTLGLNPPSDLGRSLYPDAKATSARPPKGLIHPRFAEGASTWFDWNGAGVVELGSQTASMHRGQQLFRRLLYGFDSTHLYLRLEPNGGGLPPGATFLVRARDLDIEWSALQKSKLHAETPELGVSFEALGARPGDRVRVSLCLVVDGAEIERYPSPAPLEVVVPDPSYEARNWSV